MKIKSEDIAVATNSLPSGLARITNKDLDDHDLIKLSGKVDSGYISVAISLGDLKKYIMGISDDKTEFREEMEKKSPEILEDILGKEFNKFFEEISKKDKE